MKNNLKNNLVKLSLFILVVLSLIPDAIKAQNKKTLLVVRAKMVLGQSDLLDLYLNDKKMTTWTVSGLSYKDYIYEVEEGTYKIDLYFPDNTTDMSIDYLKIGYDEIYQTEQFANNEGAFDFAKNDCGVKFGDEIMYCKGFMRFGSIEIKYKTAVSGIALDTKSLSLNQYKNQQLKATVSPSNASNWKVNWKSDVNSIATVDENGNVNALLPGETIIRVTTSDGGFSDSCKVTVISTPNLKPRANAGFNTYVLLPKNSAVLKGKGSDQDGTIAAYKWTQTEGKSAILEGANSPELVVKNLSEGKYTFSLEVKDDKGATHSDETIVTVLKENPIRMGPYPHEVLETFVNVEDYGAFGNDTIDDTKAIQAAMNFIKNDVNSRSIRGQKIQILYFPAGNYLVSDKLTFGSSQTQYIIVMGEYKENTKIILKANSPGFENPLKPREVFAFFDGGSNNNSFWNSVFNLTIEVEGGNPGAVALQYHNNNAGRVQDVNLIAHENSGKYGLFIDKGASGLGMIKHLYVDGFEIGVNIYQSLICYTLEHIQIRNQRVFGIQTVGKPLQIRKLISDQTIQNVPAINILPNEYPNVVVLDSKLNNTAGGEAAIVNSSFLFARNVDISGYSSGIKSKNELLFTTRIPEFVSDKVYTLWPDVPKESLGLESRDVPEVPWDIDFANWGILDLDKVDYAKQADALQELIDAGYSTIFIKSKSSRYEPDKTVIIRKNVKRIHGGWCTVRPSDALLAQSKPIWQIETTSADTLVFQEFMAAFPPSETAWWWQNNSTKPLLLQDIEYQVQLYMPYKNAENAGDLFIEQVYNHTLDGNGMEMNYKPDGWWVFNKQNVWIRNLDPEWQYPQITNNGGNMWVLGFKVGEWHGPYFITRNGKSEIMGGHFNSQDYSKMPPPAGEDYMILNDNSFVTVIGSDRVRSSGSAKHPVAVKEIREGVARTLLYSDFPRVRSGAAIALCMYRGGTKDPWPVAVNEIRKSDMDISVYPNPAGEEINIRIESANRENRNWQIYNTLGEVVKSGIIMDSNSSNNQFKINVSGLKTGLYYLKVSKFTTKIVISK